MSEPTPEQNAADRQRAAEDADFIAFLDDIEKQTEQILRVVNQMIWRLEQKELRRQQCGYRLCARYTQRYESYLTKRNLVVRAVRHTVQRAAAGNNNNNKQKCNMHY